MTPNDYANILDVDNKFDIIYVREVAPDSSVVFYNRYTRTAQCGVVDVILEMVVSENEDANVVLENALVAQLQSVHTGDDRVGFHDYFIYALVQLDEVAT